MLHVNRPTGLVMSIYITGEGGDLVAKTSPLEPLIYVHGVSMLHPEVLAHYEVCCENFWVSGIREKQAVALPPSGITYIKIMWICQPFQIQNNILDLLSDNNEAKDRSAISQGQALVLTPALFSVVELNPGARV